MPAFFFAICHTVIQIQSVTDKLFFGRSGGRMCSNCLKWSKLRCFPMIPITMWMPVPWYLLASNIRLDLVLSLWKLGGEKIEASSALKLSLSYLYTVSKFFPLSLSLFLSQSYCFSFCLFLCFFLLFLSLFPSVSLFLFLSLAVFTPLSYPSLVLAGLLFFHGLFFFI